MNRNLLTIHHMVSKVDSGSILVKYYPSIHPGEGEFEVSCRAFVGAAAEMSALVAQVSEFGTLPPGVPQDGPSRLYLAKYRTLLRDIQGWARIQRNLSRCELPERIERFY